MTYLFQRLDLRRELGFLKSGSDGGILKSFLERMLEAGGRVDENELGPILQKHLVFGADCLRPKILGKLVLRGKAQVEMVRWPR